MTFFQLKNCAAIIIICNQHRGDRSRCGLQEKCCSFVVYINIYNFHLKKKKKGRESAAKTLSCKSVFTLEMCSSKTLAYAMPFDLATPPTSLDF